MNKIIERYGSQIYKSNYRDVKVRLHVYIWENYNKMGLPSGYCIHHLDENTKNNTINNLVLLTKSEHVALHNRMNKTGENSGMFNKKHSIESKIKMMKSKKGTSIALKNRNGLQANRTEWKITDLRNNNIYYGYPSVIKTTGFKKDFIKNSKLFLKEHFKCLKEV